MKTNKTLKRKSKSDQDRTGKKPCPLSNARANARANASAVGVAPKPTYEKLMKEQEALQEALAAKALTSGVTKSDLANLIKQQKLLIKLTNAAMQQLQTPQAPQVPQVPQVPHYVPDAMSRRSSPEPVGKNESDSRKALKSRFKVTMLPKTNHDLYTDINGGKNPVVRVLNADNFFPSGLQDKISSNAN